MPVTVDEYFPFDSGPGSSIGEAQWRKMGRLWLSSGPVQGIADGCQVTADGTGGRVVRVQSGQLWVDGFFGEVAAQKTLPVSANSSGQPRIDTVVARADVTNNRVELDVVAGTAGASPVAPALTQSATVWEVPLANVAVASGASSFTQGNITDRRSWAAGRVPSADPSYRPPNVAWGFVAEAVVSGPIVVGQGIATVAQVSMTAVSGRRYRATFNGTYRSSASTVFEVFWLLDGVPAGNVALYEGVTDVPVVGTTRTWAWAGTRLVTVQHNHVSGGDAEAFYTGGNGGPMHLLVEDIGPT